MKTIKCKVLKTTKYPGVTITAGEIVDVPSEYANELRLLGKVEFSEEEIELNIESGEGKPLGKMRLEELQDYGLGLGLEVDGLTKKPLLALIKEHERDNEL